MSHRFTPVVRASWATVPLATCLAALFGCSGVDSFSAAVQDPYPANIEPPQNDAGPTAPEATSPGVTTMDAAPSADAAPPTVDSSVADDAPVTPDGGTGEHDADSLDARSDTGRSQDAAQDIHSPPSDATSDIGLPSDGGARDAGADTGMAHDAAVRDAAVDTGIDASDAGGSTQNFTTPVPLIDLGRNTYRGFQGGLYPNGSNDVPSSHRAAAEDKARSIVPLDTSGNPDSANGKIVMLTVGMSNTTQESCHHDGVTNVLAATCQDWTFMGRARDDAAVNHSSLVLVNGARGGMSAEYWMSPQGIDPLDPVQTGDYPVSHTPPSCGSYSTQRDNLGPDGRYNEEWDRIDACNLQRNGYSSKQVQVAWVKLSKADATAYRLPDPQADAFNLKHDLGNVVRTMKVRYPNLKMVFLSSRVYGAYGGNPATDPGFSPSEPYAYETGFGVKWLIEAQINQMANGGTRVESPSMPGYAGDLNYDTVAPWVGWGPYLWSNGSTANSQGTAWPRSYFFPAAASDYGQADGIHPNHDGESQVGQLLVDFFKTSPASSCWFLAGGRCQ